MLSVWRNISSTMSLRLRVTSPTIRNPASREIISDSVESWESEHYFFLIQLTETNNLLLKINKISPEIDFESSSTSARSESLDESICSAVSYFPHDSIVGSSCASWMYEIYLTTHLSHVWVHSVNWSCKITDRPECQVCQVGSNLNNLLFAIDFLQLSWWDRLKLFFPLQLLHQEFSLHVTKERSCASNCTMTSK